MFGISSEIIDEIETKDDQFEIWPENWPAVQLFMAVQTQWRVGPAGAIGLDYSSVDVVIRHRNMTITPEDWEGIQTMEYAALAMWAESNDKS